MPVMVNFHGTDKMEHAKGTRGCMIRYQCIGAHCACLYLCALPHPAVLGRPPAEYDCTAMHNQAVYLQAGTALQHLAGTSSGNSLKHSSN